MTASSKATLAGRLSSGHGLRNLRVHIPHAIYPQLQGGTKGCAKSSLGPLVATSRLNLDSFGVSDFDTLLLQSYVILFLSESGMPDHREFISWWKPPLDSSLLTMQQLR